MSDGPDFGRLLYAANENAWQSPRLTALMLVTGLAAALVLYAFWEPSVVSVLFGALTVGAAVGTFAWWRRSVSRDVARVYEGGVWLASGGGQLVAFAQVRRAFERTDRHGPGSWNRERSLFLEMPGGSSVAIGGDLRRSTELRKAVIAVLAAARPDLVVEEGERYPE